MSKDYTDTSMTSYYDPETGLVVEEPQTVADVIFLIYRNLLATQLKIEDK